MASAADGELEAVPGRPTPRGGWPRRRVTTPCFPVPSVLPDGGTLDEVGIPYSGTKGSKRARAMQVNALEIAANARKTKMYITAGDQGYMDINFTAGPEEYWEKVHLRDEMEIREERRCMKLLLQRIRERPKVARHGLAYLDRCVKARLLDGARLSIQRMTQNYRQHCCFKVSLLNSVYEVPEKPKDPDRFGMGRSQVGMSNVEHLQRMAAEDERKEQARLQRHRMQADCASQENGRRRLDSINRAAEARARAEEARLRREKSIERRSRSVCHTVFPGAAQNRAPALSHARQQKQRLYALPKESLYQHMKRWSRLWQMQMMMRLVRTWRNRHADFKQHLHEQRLGQQRCGSAGLFGTAKVHCARLNSINESEMRPKGFGLLKRQLCDTTVRTNPILFEMHARQQQENLHQIKRHFRVFGKESYEIPQSMRIQEERLAAKQKMHPQLRAEADSRQQQAFLRFSYHKLCRRMVESFKTKSGALYNTITNLLTLADLNIKERQQSAVNHWKINRVDWQRELERRQNHQAQMMKTKKAMKKVAQAMALEFEQEVKPKFDKRGKARYTFVQDGEHFLTKKRATPLLARDKDGWPIETLAGRGDFRNGMAFPDINAR